MPKLMKPDHLGDGVYALDGGYGLTIKLHTNHHEYPDDVVVLEEDTLDALIRYRERLKQHRESQSGEEVSHG